MDWSLAGYKSHPVDGEATVVAASAGRLGGVAADVRDQITQLKGLGRTEEIWESSAGSADKLQSALDELPVKLDLVATRYERVSEALDEFHPVLASAKQDAEYWIVQAEAAQDEVERAEAGVAEMEDHENSDSDEEWEGEDYRAGLETAQGEAQSAIANVRNTVEAFNTAAETCADAILDACNDNLQDHSVFSGTGLGTLVSGWLEDIGIGVDAAQGAAHTPTSDELGRQLEEARAEGLHPSEYADLLQQYWLTVAAENAGIDLSGWDPSLGAEAMLPYLVASYEYYGQLYMDNPDFQWAGMAGMIGPTFAGGMFDLQMLERFSDIASGPLDAVPDWAKGPLLAAMPAPLRDIAVLGEMGEAEFDYYETKLLEMQKQIFTDQMPMHEAYMAMGMEGIEEMRDAGLIDNQMVDAWRDIDSGDPGRVADGNADLLYREQHEIIADDYDDMRNYHGPVGQAMTYTMGAIGAPGIPGAQSLGEYDPLTFGVSVDPWGPGPHGSVEVETPLPDGNISNADTRWDLIENDTLPAFQELIENDPERVEEILSGDVAERINDARLHNNIDDLVGRLGDWQIDVDGGLW